MKRQRKKVVALRLTQTLRCVAECVSQAWCVINARLEDECKPWNRTLVNNAESVFKPMRILPSG